MSRPIENTERVSTYVSKETLKALQEQAASKGMTVSGYIRYLIMDAVKQQ